MIVIQATRKDGTRQTFEADRWSVGGDGFMYLYRGASTEVAVLNLDDFASVERQDSRETAAEPLTLAEPEPRTRGQDVADRLFTALCREYDIEMVYTFHGNGAPGCKGVEQVSVLEKCDSDTGRIKCRAIHQLIASAIDAERDGAAKEERARCARLADSILVSERSRMHFASPGAEARAIHAHGRDVAGSIVKLIEGE